MSLKLDSAPIIEAVIEFYCELPPGQDRSGWEAALKGRFGDHYPHSHVNLVQEFQVNVEGGPDHPPSSTMRQGVHGYRHSSRDGKQLVQCRLDGFFFNRLAPYTSFDDYLPEALRCWALYREVTHPVIVRQLGLRYINRLPLPIIEGRISLDEYLQHPPRVVTPSDKYAFISTQFLHQHQMLEPKTQTMATVVLASQPVEAGILPVVVEISAIRAGDFDPADSNTFGVALKSLRDLKNHVFENTITPKCLKLFQ
jgi:uncharacterized protein (TIGR04255 family)